MCKKWGVNLVKILTIILAVMMLVPSVARHVDAAGNTMADVGKEISKTDMEELTLTTTNIITSIPRYTGTVSALQPGDGNGIEMEVGAEYTATYPAELDYFGTPLSVQVTVKLLDKSDMPATGSYCRLYIDNNGHVKVVWKKGYNVKVSWQIDITDPNSGEGYPVSFLVGYKDPDESNYDFTTSGRALLYINDEQKLAAKHYLVKSNGLYRIDDDGTELDPKTYMDNPSNFLEATFLVGLNPSDNGSFAFKTTTFSDGAIEVPYFYAKYYDVTYVLNDEDGPAANNPKENPTSYHTTGNTIDIEDPTRPGYEFLGWTDENGTPKDSIDPWEEGDKTFVAQWKKIEYKIEYRPNEEYAGGEGSVKGEMDDQTVTLGDNTLNDNQYSADGYKFVGWNTKPDGSGKAFNDPDNYPVTVDDIEGKEDGDTIGILYAQWEPIEYTIKYDPNGGEGEMDDDDHRKYDTDYNLSTHLYTREGYNWVGWNTEPGRDGQEYTENEEYRNLTKEDGGVVTMYAQWEPWKYYIDYDPNGGTGDMPMQTFTYEDESMMSEKNKFTRDGYKFTGFVYSYNGNTKLITDPAEFREMLLSLGPESKITLIAQWEKIATAVVAIPVTGVE
ncbi:MAG: InlB B-repeat-containing protein [Erysipelotrichaceae bacterium]|nr:InlB B-repeat-containing protein [Erysipelotrichaceae bacterium]